MITTALLVSTLVLGRLVAIGLLGLIVVWIAAVIWVYSDSQTNSRHSAKIWTFVVFFGGILGLLLYFRIGRGKPSERPGRRTQFEGP